jgi:hypothetical protein
MWLEKNILALSAIGILLFSVSIVGNTMTRSTYAEQSCENLKVEKPTATGYAYNNNPGKAVDNNFNTYWQRNAKGSWIDLELEEGNTICHITVAWHLGDTRSYYFKISISNGTSAYTDVYKGKSSGKTERLETYEFADKIASHVKITVNGNTRDHRAFIDEIRVYGYKPIVMPPPEPIPEPTPEPVPPPISNNTSNKYFFATMLQYVSIDAQVGMYGPNMATADQSKIHVGKNAQVTSAQLDGLLSLPGTHGMEYFTLAEISNNAPALKGKGIEFISYDLEPGANYSPEREVNDPVGSVSNASKIAHDNGLLLMCTPSRAITANYGPQLAPYCDLYHIQSQGLQDNPAAFEAFVESITAKLRANNPDIKITIQFSTQRGSAPGMTLLETMQHDFGRVEESVDGVTLWFSGSNIAVVKSFAEWFNANYR